MPSMKRLGDDDDASEHAIHHHQHHPHHHHHHSSSGPNKAARTDDNGHYAAATATSSSAANSNKKKSAGSTRTGQACDRCKIRKIRCDARPGGCSPCLQNNTECKTTDRITGRATSRGHTESIENENAQLKVYMLELQQQLRESGVEPKAPPAVPAGYTSAFTDMPYYSPTHGWDMQQDTSNGGGGGSGSGSGNGGSSTTTITAGTATHKRRGSHSTAALLPNFRDGCIGDNYLGVSSENNWLSPIEGTALALFGTKIDLAEFMPSESDPAVSAMSYRTFLNHAFGRGQPFVPTLPPYEQCKVYAEWYFRSIQIFIPLLHKPDHMRLLDRIYNENYHARPAELVMVHMVLAIMNFQFSARNANTQARHDSMSHYHYALGFIPDLITSHKLEDIQALTLICSQLRNQPRPGGTWMFTNMVMGLAIESGLHRSADAWQGSAVNQDAHHLEMRKRIFWSLLVFHVHVSGKLGRPMPLRLEDFDIEVPEPQPDNVAEEPGATTWEKCSWRAAVQGFKMLKIMMQVYSSIYSIKSTGQYERNVRALEKELDAFHASIPPELRGGPDTREADRVAALYLELTIAECQLLLHHPSLCRSASPEVARGNLDVCLQWSNKMLDIACQLRDLKSLDTTWYYWTDFIAAIFTTLFASTERRDQMDSEDLQRLKQDMDRWLEVMGEATVFLGATSQLQSAVQHIVEFSLGNLTRHIAAKTASAAVASTASPPTQSQPPPQQTYSGPNGTNTYYVNGTSTGDMSTNGQTYMNGHGSHHQQQTPNPYPSGNPFTYPPPQDSNLAAYGNGVMPSYDPATYSAAEAKPNIEAQLVAQVAMDGQHQHPAHSSFMTAFQSPLQGYPQGMDAHNGYLQSGPAAWRHFADSMVTNVSGQEYMHSAGGALMALSGGKHPDTSMAMAAATMENMHVPPDDSNQPWPVSLYALNNQGIQQR